MDTFLGMVRDVSTMIGGWLSDGWGWVLSHTPHPGPPPWWVWAVALAVAAAAVAAPALARPRQWLSTLVHEVGHALAGAVLAREVRAISMRAHGSGETQTAGRDGGIAFMFTAYAGYPAPAWAATAATYAIHTHYPSLGIWGIAAGCLLLLPFTLRSATAAAATLAVGAAAAATAWWGTPTTAYTLLACLAATLTAAAWLDLRMVYRLCTHTQGTGEARTDAHIIRDGNGIPLTTTLCVWALSIGAATATTAYLAATT